jgi:murein DD-endopeptidase MepM/ murein hydrolase activator NlpD
MHCPRVWFLIAVLLFLGYSPAHGASSYLRVNHHGVVYYYFNNRDSVPPPQSHNSSPPRRQPASNPGPSPCLTMPLASLLGPCQNSPAAALSPDLPQPATRQLLPDPAALLAAAPLPEPSEDTAAEKPGLLSLLTKLNFFDPPGATSGEFLFPSLLSCHFVVPDVWARTPKFFQPPAPTPQWLPDPQAALPFPKMPPLPKYAYQPRLWGRVVTDPGTFKPSSCVYYCFPVARPFNFRDTWGDPRPGGRTHRAVDIFAPEGNESYAITAGVIGSLSTSETGGIMLFLQGHDGRGYGYMHLLSYAPGIVPGKEVKAGELIGYVGRTGTHQSPAHLHIQVYPDHELSHETLVNPYSFLVQLCRGIGVDDLNQPKLAREPNLNPLKIVRQPDARPKKNKINWIQVYQRPWPKGAGERPLQLDLKGSPLLIIRNN